MCHLHCLTDRFLTSALPQLGHHQKRSQFPSRDSPMVANEKYSQPLKQQISRRKTKGGNQQLRLRCDIWACLKMSCIPFKEGLSNRYFW